MYLQSKFGDEDLCTEQRTPVNGELCLTKKLVFLRTSRETNTNTNIYTVRQKTEKMTS